MKASVIQVPYSMDVSDADSLFEKKIQYLDECDDSMDLIVLPEYSDVPTKTSFWEDTYELHSKYIDILLEKCSETAKRCDAVLFVNALSKTETGYRNTTYGFGRDGALIGKYFKKHLPPSELFDLHLDSDYTREFSKPYVLEYEGIRYGFLTCYDFYFYEAFAAIARENVDIIIGCSLQRSDSHSALEIMGRFCAYNCNAHLVRASVSLSPTSEICGASMIVTPKGEMLVNMRSDVGIGSAEFDPRDKYYKPAGFGGALAPHYEYIEFGRNPWQYRPGGSAIVRNETIMPYPRICANRGICASAPENSLPALGAAVALGAEEISFDLCFTKDGEIVATRDDPVNALELDLEAKFGDAYKGLKIARFEDILKKFSCHAIMNIHIESKCETDFEYNMLEKTVSMSDRYDCRKYLYFSTSCESTLEALMKIAPDIPGCFTVSEPSHIDIALKHKCSKVQLSKNDLDIATVKKAKESGLICNICSADTAEEAEKFLDMGIDTLMTNNFCVISDYMEKRKGR